MEKEVVKDWVTKAGLRAVILKMDHCVHQELLDKLSDAGKNFFLTNYYCGYVGFLKNHPGFKIVDLLEDAVDVHGGITFTDGDGQHPIRSYLYWLGFNCAHAYNKIDKCNLEYVTNECESLADQIRRKGCEQSRRRL